MEYGWSFYRLFDINVFLTEAIWKSQWTLACCSWIIHIFKFVSYWYYFGQSCIVFGTDGSCTCRSDGSVVVAWRKLVCTVVVVKKIQNSVWHVVINGGRIGGIAKNSISLVRFQSFLALREAAQIAVVLMLTWGEIVLFFRVWSRSGRSWLSKVAGGLVVVLLLKSWCVTGQKGCGGYPLPKLLSLVNMVRLVVNGSASEFYEKHWTYLIALKFTKHDFSGKRFDFFVAKIVVFYNVTCPYFVSLSYLIHIERVIIGPKYITSREPIFCFEGKTDSFELRKH